jgi:hypothetical protein
MMQIEGRLNLVETALEPLGAGAVDPGETIERLWRRRGGAGFLDPTRASIRARGRTWRNR